MKIYVLEVPWLPRPVEISENHFALLKRISEGHGTEKISNTDRDAQRRRDLFKVGLVHDQGCRNFPNYLPTELGETMLIRAKFRTI